ncbi:molybdate ABC transporter substrate-binding protein [Polynucleobacter sp. AP-Latsch-80-C2]|uniref:molybdate ABC transporter substrate-binding protein n=1 Tax=Polynucleobacter sp. AP-Latsch-80-C2 TaxID=2576931 RepID=UPI0021052423|nr:molybdate ABC transporter substrate-binding protein [Polynucleobacter sp. AP-Latsch-80-C2]
MRTLIVSLILLCSQSLGAQPVMVAVAANMKEAFTEIAAAYKTNNQSDFRVVYGSSGNFTAQIMNGAPFKLFISADEHFPLELYRQGKTINEGTVYAIGKLTFISKKSFNASSLKNKADLAKLIGNANKVAIAKPDLAPYGKAAIEYLKAEGLWELAKDKLIYGDNIGVATMYVVSGAADVGFTALSLASSADVAKETSYTVLDSKQYQPIAQRMVLMKRAPKEAIELYQFMQSPQAKGILQKYGYITP